MANVSVNREDILAGHFLLRHLRPEELSTPRGARHSGASSAAGHDFPERAIRAAA